MDFLEILVDCRKKFGAPPRRFSWWSRRFSASLNVTKPTWMIPEDGLLRFYAEFHQVLANGFVTWGHIVQANSTLFDKGPNDAPGELLYCSNPGVIVTPHDLGGIAECLFQLKGTTPHNPSLRVIADHLTNETTRAFGLLVPVKSKATLALSTTMFHRHHLPDGKLTIPFLPIVVSTTGSGVVVPLPFSFWPPELEHWYRGTPAESIDSGPARVNYRKWLTTVLSWDATIAILVVLIPVLLALFIPQRRAATEIAAIALPIVGLLARLYFGARHIANNHCGARLQTLQLIALFLAIIVVCLLEAFAILTMEMQNGAIPLNRADVIASTVMSGIYFLLVTFAMYPGKGWD